jgi:hypothetical protein
MQVATNANVGTSNGDGCKIAAASIHTPLQPARHWPWIGTQRKNNTAQVPKGLRACARFDVKIEKILINSSANRGCDAATTHKRRAATRAS